MAGSKKQVTYKGATPAGGVSDELQVEDPKDGKRFVFVKDQPLVVGEDVEPRFVKLGKEADYQKFEEEDVAAEEESKS